MVLSLSLEPTEIHGSIPAPMETASLAPFLYLSRPRFLSLSMRSVVHETHDRFRLFRTETEGS